ncbi:MAG: glycerophosphoryl diester phosphodiesterase membrane domain-containing protein [Candidatus Diapherotrites archaeon]
MNYEEVVKFAFAWTKIKETWKHVLTITGAWIFAAVLLVLMIAGLAMFVLLPTLQQGFISPMNFFTPEFLFPFLGILLMSIIIFTVVAGTVFAFATGMIYLFALKTKNLPAPFFNWKKAFSLVLLGLAESLAALFSIFNLKLLLILVAGVFGIYLMSFPRPANIAGILITIVSLLIYFVVYFYNAIRLSLSSAIFMSQDMGIIQSIRESWLMTEGRVLEVFIATMLISVILMVINSIISMLFFALSLVTTPLTFMGLGFISSIFSLVLIFIENAITIPLAMLIGIFGTIAIYNEVLTKHEKKESKIKPAVSPEKFMTKTRA